MSSNGIIVHQPFFTSSRRKPFYSQLISVNGVRIYPTSMEYVRQDLPKHPWIYRSRVCKRYQEFIDNLELIYFFKSVCETPPALPIIHEHIIDLKDIAQRNAPFRRDGTVSHQISYRSGYIKQNICIWVPWIRTFCSFCISSKFRSFEKYMLNSPWNTHNEILVLRFSLLFWMFHPTLKFMMGCLMFC